MLIFCSPCSNTIQIHSHTYSPDFCQHVLGKSYNFSYFVTLAIGKVATKHFLRMNISLQGNLSQVRYLRIFKKTLASSANTGGQIMSTGEEGSEKLDNKRLKSPTRCCHSKFQGLIIPNQYLKFYMRNLIRL